MTTPGFARATPLGQGVGLYPRLDSAVVGALNNETLVAATESGEQDTALTGGFSVLHLWVDTGSSVVQIAQYGTTGVSAGAGLPALTDWPYLRVTGNDELYFALYVDPGRRYFRLVADLGMEAYWMVTRV